MKRTFIVFVILLFSVWFGLTISHDPGYIALLYKNWLIEMPLWFFLVSELLLFTICYLLLRALGFIAHIFQNTRGWIITVRTRRAYTFTTQGFIRLSKEEWGSAEKYFIKAAKYNQLPLINYLAAAHAAQKLGATQRRNAYLQRALHTAPDAKIVVEITRAKLQIENGEDEQAIITLNHILHGNSKHRVALKFLKNIFEKKSDWTALQEILPKLKASHTLSAEEFSMLEYKTYAGLLGEPANHTNLQALQKFWRKVPSSLQKSETLNECYANYLLDLNADNEAEYQLRKILQIKPNDKLMMIYGLTKSSNPEQQLSFAEKYLAKEPQNPHVLLALGRICARNQLWGKARTYLSNSLEIYPQAETYAELANLLKKLGEQQLSAEYYREGLLSVSKIKK